MYNLLGRTTVLMLALQVLVACVNDDQGGGPPHQVGDGGAEMPKTCEELDARFTGARQTLSADLVACESIADCVLVEPRLDCADVDISLAGCPVPLNADQVDTYRSRIDALGTSLCMPALAGCRAGPSCAAQTLDCVEGTCSATNDEES